MQALVIKHSSGKIEIELISESPQERAILEKQWTMEDIHVSCEEWREIVELRNAPEEGFEQ